MEISLLTLLLIIFFVILITYMYCSYTLNCDVVCKINYNKHENFNYKELRPKKRKKIKVKEENNYVFCFNKNVAKLYRKFIMGIIKYLSMMNM